MSQPVSPERAPPDAEGLESSPGTNQGDTPNKGRKKKGDKKPIAEKNLTVDIQQWLQEENGKAVKVKITDLKFDKTKCFESDQPVRATSLAPHGHPYDIPEVFPFFR